MKSINYKKLAVGLLLLITFVPFLVSAQVEYKPLVEFVPAGAGDGLGGLVNTLYALSITIAALLAVIKIIVAGVKWMMTDIVTSKSEAKRDIKGALIGLIIVLAAVMILTIINSDLTNFSFGIDRVDRTVVVNSSVTNGVIDTDLSEYSTEQRSNGRSGLNRSPRDIARDGAREYCLDRNGTFTDLGTSVRCQLPSTGN